MTAYRAAHLTARLSPAGAGVWLALVALALATPVAQATTYVSMPDEALVDLATVAAVLRVESKRAAPAAPAVDYEMSVERLLKGALPAGRVTVRVPGGAGPGGRALRIWGAPQFREQERVLLFLAPRRDGTHEVLHLALGAFHIVELGTRSVALRDLSGMREARSVRGAIESVPSGPDSARDLGRFARWTVDRAAGRRRAADYFTALPELDRRRLNAPFTLFELGGLNLRWFEFDSSGSVAFGAHEDGQDGVTGGGFTEIQSSLAAWNADPVTPVSYTYGGTTTASAGFTVDDGQNTVLFNDPNDEISPFTCGFGGVLAIGGVWFDAGDTGVFDGTTYLRIPEADVVTNDGLACFFASSIDAAAAAEELFAHELGHTLGINHSAEGDALMNAFLHNDGRGASLAADDHAALRALYGTSASSFFTVTPCRLLDSRDPVGPMGGSPLSSGFTFLFAGDGHCGIPPTARSISVNVTVVNATAAGHLTVFGEGAVPGVSTLNFGGGQVRANNAVVALSSAGDFRINAFVLGDGQVHTIVDLNGYFQ